ncbi:MAG TPA: alginate export family protein [Povalibacter sp.]|nr:alginate export family protein [Povalibacter sp.]
MQLAVSGTHCIARRWKLAATVALLASAAPVLAADETSHTVPGFPPGVDWTFEFGATWGAFGFGHSLYTDPHPDDPSGNLTNDWMEGSIKAGVGGVYALQDSSEFYGKLSAVGARTYGAAPTLVGEDASSYSIEDAYIGWRSGKSLGSSENLLDFTVGRARYRLGHGMLLWDGASEGGSRGAYWTNARQAFQLAAIGRFQPGKNKFEAFYLERDELPESNNNSKLWGVNYEYAFNEDNVLGATYMKWSANPAEAPQRDGLDVYNLRAFISPIPALKPLSFELEYAKQDNGEALDSEAWNALVAWQLESAWKPRFSYRYAFFEGDDPATTANEAFDGLFAGFYDWGTWWQGEIAGEYFVSNSNLISHQLRVHTKPTESIGTGLIFYEFLLDHPESAGVGVTSDKVATELDWYMDWSINDHFTCSFVAAVADPGRAVEQSSGRTDTFYYGMIFVAYSY